MSEKFGIYGQVTVADPGVIPTEVVDRIHGFRVGRSRDGHPEGIELQLDVGDSCRNLAIPILEAMALLSMMKAMQLNEDLPFPDDPRDPTWTAASYKKRS